MSTTPEISATAAIQLESIGQVALTVHDLAESKRFYQDVLGMRFLFDAGSMAFFQVGNVRLMIGLPEKETHPEGTILYFRVTDIQGVAEAFKHKSVVFVQEPHLVAKMPDHDLWMAFFKDPTGNVLGLMSEVASQPAEATAARDR
jgi:methylmalonyl-CoA/ethylmalonyl-CoA epimerase